MTPQLQKESFSFAYVYAVASAAGFAIHNPHPDRNCVDLKIQADDEDFGVTSVCVELQVKCTEKGPKGDAPTFPYRLETPHYNTLRVRGLSPRLLIVVAVPPAVDEWVSQSEANLILYKGGYFVDLSGRKAVPNKSNVTIDVPRENLFTVEAVRTWMKESARRVSAALGVAQ
jgi:hypothetical protein